MKALTITLLVYFSLSPIKLHAESYQDCILENIKYVNDKSAVDIVEYSCLYKKTPKKCRKYVGENIEMYLFYKKSFDIDRELGGYSCLEECEKASFFERQFGDCSTD